LNFLAEKKGKLIEFPLIFNKKKKMENQEEKGIENVIVNFPAAKVCHLLMENHMLNGTLLQENLLILYSTKMCFFLPFIEI
jgi:hypothetical protein